jgi:hypothetical protein
MGSRPGREPTGRASGIRRRAASADTGATSDTGDDERFARSDHGVESGEHLGGFGLRVVPSQRHETCDGVRHRVGPEGDRTHERQNAFLRAVETNFLIEIVRGHFRSDVRLRALAERYHPPEDLFVPRLEPIEDISAMLVGARGRRTTPATMARVVIPEEKGFDVNLGSHLLYDALKGHGENAIVITTTLICVNRFDWWSTKGSLSVWSTPTDAPQSTGGSPKSQPSSSRFDRTPSPSARCRTPW